MVMVRVCYFARSRELAGCDSEEIDLPEQTTAEQISQLLGEKHPDLTQLLTCSRIAVAESFITAEVNLKPGIEVAVIPPVSGG